MKKMLSKCMMVVVAFLFVSVFAINTSKAQGSVSLQVFYDELQPYGTWMSYRDYGYVWVPRVDAGFTPYGTNGYWVNTEYGNTWVSDYSWGWAPFHYGRWFYDDFYGWVWVPDSEWAPAWVAWRNGGGYYGWAPLMPGFGFSVSANYYNRIPDSYWSFVPHHYIMYRHVHTHFIPRPRVVTIIHNTTIVTNNYRDRRSTYFTGPSRRELETSTRSRVEVHKVSTRNSPGKMDVRRGTVNIYRPDVDDSRESRRKAAPTKVVRDERRDNSREQVDARRESQNTERKVVAPAQETKREQPAREQRDSRRDNEEVKQLKPSERENATREERRKVENVPSENPKREQQVRESNDNRRANEEAMKQLKQSERENAAREEQRRNIEQAQRKQQVERQNQRENARPENNNVNRQERQQKQREVVQPQPRVQREQQRTPAVERRSPPQQQRPAPARQQKVPNRKPNQ